MKRSRLCQILMRSALLPLLGVLTQPQLQLHAENEITAEQTEFFEARIRPVLAKQCYKCHSTESGKTKGGLLLDTKQAMLSGGDSGPVLVPGKPDESLILQALRYEDLEMPPTNKLGADIVADFETWIRSGAPDPRIAVAQPGRKTQPDPSQSLDFWAFQKPAIKQPADVQDSKWVRNEIDKYVLNGLEPKRLGHATEADRRTFIRRAYFDLIGLPPEPEAVQRFLKDDSPQAFERLIDELLASPHYGERWGRHWLDLARYAEDQAHTFKARMYPQGYLYRDWVVQAINDDMPYNDFLKMQIAGDLVDKNRPVTLAALGMFALGPVYYQDNGEKDQAMADEWDDRLDTLMRGTQALTVACARCHDHKFDPISMADYYGLAGIFASSEYAELPVVPEHVIRARRDADEKVAGQQLLIDTYRARLAPSVRLKLVDKISDYLIAAWELRPSPKDDKPKKKQVEEIARKNNLDAELLARWVAWLAADEGSGAIDQQRPYHKKWQELQATLANEKSPESARQLVRQFAGDLQKKVQSLLPEREPLQNRFGDNFAFISDSNRYIAEPGVIPLGNQFDDKKGTPLKTSITSDRFRAVATNNSLGVNRVVQGWGDSANIADGIRLNLKLLGSDSQTHGTVSNDAWSSESGGIRTEGKKCISDSPRTEQGIGMHANALITFDLDEIRKAGLIPAQNTMRFRVDRAGINDDAIGQGGRVHMAVVISKPHTDKSRYDAIIAAQLDGKTAKIIENDTVYYFEGELPKPLVADGKYSSFDLPVPPNARYVTMIVTGAGEPGEENTINSDHAVFSNVRLEYQPTDAQIAEFKKGQEAAKLAQADAATVRSDALLLSEMFDESGVLGLSADKIDGMLAPEQSTELQVLQAELAKRTKSAEAIAIPKAHTLTDGDGHDLKIYLSGDPKKQGEIAKRSIPAVLTGGKRQTFSTSGSGRLELADRLASEENPLTARVIVNRIWAGHFGFGLVRTLNNFGSLGEPPSHPELLDYLACRLVENDWSLKSIHREIMLSATYRQSSSGNTSNQEIDPENRLLWRMNRRRLEIEPWRDAVLAVTGQLDDRLGGPSGRLDDNFRRRTLYGSISRHKLDDLLRLFDFPDPNITSGQRTSTTVPLQQLFILNSEFMMKQATALANRLQKEAATDDARIRRAFDLLFNREPTADELTMAQDFLRSPMTDQKEKMTRLEQFSLALLGTNEFAYLD